MKNYIFLLTFVFGLSSCVPTIEEILPSGVNQIDAPEYFAFEPAVDAKTGFIFYPGAGIEAESYNSWLVQLSELGYLAVSVKMPLNLAVLDMDAALRIPNKFPEIDNWIIGGHSLGGAMAIELLNKPVAAEKFKALVLLAAYPSATTDISNWNGEVLSLSASNDNISSPADIAEGRPRLPASTILTALNEVDESTPSIFHEIPGGNHAQFGNYGLQQGDGIATISSEDQQETVVAWIDAFLDNQSW